jgi:hypothetical protein
VDSAIWFSWYDLPEEGRAEYLGWLHERYIPKVLAREGVLWGAHYDCGDKPTAAGARKFNVIDDPAVPKGTRYILCFGGERSRTFLAPTTDEFHDTLDDSDRAKLALRQGARSSIMIEETRVLGAEAAKFPDPAPCVQVGTFNAPIDFEEEAAAWFARQRVASLEGMEGVVRVRTLVAVSGWARHAILYEFASLEARGGRFLTYEKEFPKMVAWTERVAPRLVHMPGSPAVAQRIWPAQGASR